MWDLEICLTYITWTIDEEQILNENSYGMFLYVALMALELKNFFNQSSSFLNLVHRFPTGFSRKAKMFRVPRVWSSPAGSDRNQVDVCPSSWNFKDPASCVLLLASCIHAIWHIERAVIRRPGFHSKDSWNVRKDTIFSNFLCETMLKRIPGGPCAL